MFYSKTTNGFYDAALHGRAMPADAVEISEATYNALLAGQATGQEIRADASGMPVLAEPRRASATERRASAVGAIDTAAGAARARFVSAGQFIEEEYRLALQHVQQWRVADNPADAVPQAVQDWADAAGMTAEAAALSIEQTDAAWQQTLLCIRQARLAGKAAINAAPDDADFAAVAQPWIEQLAALRP